MSKDSRVPRQRGYLVARVLIASVLTVTSTVLVVLALDNSVPVAPSRQTVEHPVDYPDIDLHDYRLVFADEFDELNVSASSPKLTSTWYLYPPYGAAGSYSESKWDASALSVSLGILSSSALSVGGGSDPKENWRTGNLSSVDATGAGFAQRYGYFEAKMKMPSSGTGSWPAFWLLSKNAIPTADSTGTPYAEVDVVEWYGVNYSSDPQRGIVSQASHNYMTYNKEASDTGLSLYKPETAMPDGSLPWQNYHTYGVDVEKDFITWYIDGVETNRVQNPTAFTTAPFFIMADYALGGGYGLGGVRPGSRLQIDWIRAYERK